MICSSVSKALQALQLCGSFKWSSSSCPAEIQRVRDHDHDEMVVWMVLVAVGDAHIGTSMPDEHVSAAHECLGLRPSFWNAPE